MIKVINGDLLVQLTTESSLAFRIHISSVQFINQLNFTDTQTKVAGLTIFHRIKILIKKIDNQSINQSIRLNLQKNSKMDSSLAN